MRVEPQTLGLGPFLFDSFLLSSLKNYVTIIILEEVQVKKCLRI